MPNDKRWRKFWVDRSLKDVWLERLNALQGVKVVGTCAGHIGTPPWVQIQVSRDRDFVHLVARLSEFACIYPLHSKSGLVAMVRRARGKEFTWLSKHAWWEAVIARLEGWFGTSWRAPTFDEVVDAMLATPPKGLKR